MMREFRIALEGRGSSKSFTKDGGDSMGIVPWEECLLSARG